MHPGPHAWLYGLFCLVEIFLPAWLILGGAIPFWDELRKKGWIQAAPRGVNAAVGGVSLAALYSPVITQGGKKGRDVALVIVVFGLLETFIHPA